MPAIKVDHLVHMYEGEEGQSNNTLQDVSMQVMQNCSHSLLGATGSGKSTLMLNMMGLEKPQEGCIQIGDVIITENRRKCKPSSSRLEWCSKP